MIKKLFLFNALLSFCIMAIFYSRPVSANVAKVTMLRGKVESKIGEVTSTLKKDDWVKEGTTITTGEKSFVKLILNDQSRINIGPKSEMQVGEFKKDNPGFIKLIKGQLRAKVTKDPLEKNKNKLFIKTKSAAMGVRGTDLSVMYNSENKQTGLITYEGNVQMAQLSPAQGNQDLSVAQMTQVMEKPTAVAIKPGQFSGVNPNQTRPSIPQKMSTTQHAILRRTEVPGMGNSADQSASTKFGSPIPPNVKPASFAGGGEGIVEQVSSNLGAEALAEAGKKADEIKAETKVDAPAEGVFNKATGVYAPPAGFIVDINTGLAVPPPAGSAFDSQTGTFIIPPNIASVATDGTMNLPPNVSLSPTGKFEASGSAFGEVAGALSAAAKEVLNSMPTIELQGMEPPPLDDLALTNPEFLAGGADGAGGEFFTALQTGDPNGELLAPDGSADGGDGDIEQFNPFGTAPLAPTPIVGVTTTVNITVNVTP